MIHYQTDRDFMCVPACVMMLTDGVHGIDEIAELLDFQPGMGTNRWNLSRLEQWGYDVKMGMASETRLRSWLEGGINPILQVALMGLHSEPHSVILAGLDGDIARIHDPVQPGPTDLPLETLLSCWRLLGRFATTIVLGKVSPGRGRKGLGDTGFIYNARGDPKDVYSLSPANQTNFGRVEKVTGVLLSGDTIAAAQDECDTLAGLYRGWRNIRFPHILIHARNMRFLEPATQDYFAVTLAPSDTIRRYVWDEKEFLCTEVSYDINQEKGRILVDVTGEASTWGPDGVAGDYPRGVMAPDPPGNNPGGYWPVPPAGYLGDGNLLYFVDGTSGLVCRSRNARAADADAVIYEDLGVVNANGLVYITLDSWDSKNRAMVCGDDGVWLTEDLDADIPTWALVIDGAVAANKWHQFTMIASSIGRQGRWAVVSRYWNGDQNDWFLFVHTSDDGGETWTRRGLYTWTHVLQTERSPTIEMSSHNPDIAWIVCYLEGQDRVIYTDDNWATYSQKVLPDMAASLHPSGYHRFSDNNDDQLALFAGKSDAGAVPAVALWSEDDGTTGTDTQLTPARAGNARWCGGYTWGTNRYWVLTHNIPDAQYEFHISDDGITWALQSVLPAGTQFVSGWPFLAENFYACQNPSAGPNRGPILISGDRGATWQDQLGNWGTLIGWTGDITCCVPVWVV